ncbi:MAG TPA: cysteine--tRNA ligase [Candidatus Saccharimonadales bacterium]|nr:cysteine--tRNA ligase [Candidatus Saccharimonadales bacterium]
MKLTNTLTRTKETFKPGGPEVKLYTCGPTVYHYAHIGNLRNVIFNDTLRRSLEQTGYKVKHIMNVTDVGHLSSDADEGEDKLEKGAAREGKTVWEVAQYYLDAFNDHTKLLGILKPAKLIRATEAINPQIEIIKTLIEKGYAYQAHQAIYFDISKLKDYGKLTGQKLKDKEIGARPDVVTDPEKHHPQDFALWFFTVGHFADHQMRWPSPWGEGFPGWHLECSAIIHLALGEPIDIHTGGADHIGTHHTNEIAQSEAAFGKPLSRFWLHNEFLHVDGSKIAKSGGNSITLPDLLAKGYDPLAFRLMMLQAHYRSEQDFSWDGLNAATNLLQNLRAWADLRFQDEPTIKFKAFKDALDKPMQDDLATPAALSVISQHQGNIPDQQALELIDAYLGLGLSRRDDVSSEIKSLIADREAARRSKNYKKSDELRAKLEKQGVEVDDTPSGPRWRRISS